jgi:hypothetical protein
LTPVAKKDVRVQVELKIHGDWNRSPLQAVTGITKGMAMLDDRLREAVGVARSRGSTWEEIGTSLGVSRQAAWMRFSTD